MNTTISFWLAAARLRTLPLSVAGIITGNAIASKGETFSSLIFALSLMTAICFQIISNFANDYGDGIKGTDNSERLGPERTFQMGLLSSSALKKGIFISALISILLSLILIYVALGLEKLMISALFLLLAIYAIWAAIKYTVGKDAYGYSGFGDVFVFLFFGWVSVIGSSYLQSKTIDISALFLGTAIGLMSTGVLNLNNMRDIENDKKSQKNTLVVYLGKIKAKRYHFFLILLSGFFLLLGMGSTWILKNPFSILILLPLLFHLYRVNKIKEPKAYDPLLKQLAISTFIISMLLFVFFSIYQ
ncbi:MAG: 1,4-dihydroxy-2-naphthoate octaprenyltransferase [Flavobacteriaceae bacterium TMED212]|nr:MAG: 1,4-dihydroxy-2-naphthoate octaprenyltransferase [Flavobacteriaceae bacterium TMED212]